MVQVFARQLGTKNEAKAQFDSRTGEVIGWTSVSKEEASHFLAENHSNKIENMYETDKPEENNDLYSEEKNILSFPFGGKAKGNRNQTPSGKNNEFGIINALILRAKRCLSEMETGSLEYLKVSQLLSQYSDLLLKSQQGSENDSEIEVTESDLLALLEGK